MSDTPTRPTERMRMSERQVSVPVTALLGLVGAVSGLAGGGYYGSATTADRVSSELRELRVELRAAMDQLQRDVARLQADHTAAISDVKREASERERRLRELELWRAREDARAERDRGSTPR